MSDNKYTLLDCGDFSKLEQVGPYRFLRPSPQAVWSPGDKSKWQQQDLDAQFIRKSDGKGFWKNYNKSLPESWNIELNGVQLEMRRTGFGHIGAFVEQSDNWIEFRNLVTEGMKSRPEYRALNLFAYTGGATLALAQGGAELVHVDASKTSNSWARKNAELNGLDNHPIRWITDDVIEFIHREIRRGNTYQAIVLDPPSFGRGQKNQVWKIEEHMVPLLRNLRKIMSDDFHFISLSSHSQGYTPIALENLLRDTCKGMQGTYKGREMTVEYASGKLPAGTTCIFQCT